jgi:hypothetical protein
MTMSNKALRILIADPQHFHRMKIERLFNALGYYRVAPVQNLGELLTLVDYGCEPFDVLVINAELAAGALDLQGFVLDNPQARHALIYNQQSAPSQAIAGFTQEKVQVSLASLPNAQLIGQVMARVEAAGQRQATPDSHWLLRHANA